MNSMVISTCSRVMFWAFPTTGILIAVAVSAISQNPLLVKSTLLQWGATVMFCAWLIKALEQHTVFFEKPLSRFIAPALAFMLSAVFSFLFVTSSRDTSIDELMVRIPYFMVFLVAAVTFADLRKARLLIIAIMGIGFVVSLYGMIQHFGLDPFGMGDSYRIQSTFGNANFYVGFLTLLIPAVVAAFDLTDPGERKKAVIAGPVIVMSGLFYYIITVVTESRSLHAMVFLLLFIAVIALCTGLRLGAKTVPSVALFLLVNNIFLTRSRSGQIGLGTALICFTLCVVAFVLPFTSLRRMLVVVLAPLVVAGLVVVGVLHISFSDEGRLKTVSERKYYVEGALNLIGQKPFFGHGIGTFKNSYPLIKKPEAWAYNAVCFEHVSNIYNEHLEILHDEGVLGFAIWIWLLAVFFILTYCAIRAAPKTPQTNQECREPFWLRTYSPTVPVLVLGLISGIIALLVSNIFSLSMRYTSTGYFFWLFLGIIAAQSSRILKPSLPPQPAPAQKDTTDRKKPATLVEPGQRTPVAIRVLEGLVIVLAVCVLCVSFRFYIADVYLNRAVQYSKDAYTPMDTEGKVFHDIFIEGARYSSDSLAWEKALRYYRLSLQNNPQNLRARYFYGNAFNRRWNLHRHYNEAWGDRNSIPRTDLQRTMEQYEYIIRQAPHFTEIDFELGDLFLKLGDIDRAIASYKDYRRYKPFFTKIHYALANAYVAKKDWTNAIESYKDALDLNKKFTVAYLELSAVYRITGQDDLAEEMYELAREESPDKVDLAMADIWVRMGDQERAIRSCQARIDKDSTDAMAYAKLGWYYIKKQEWAEAVTMYEKVVRFNPRYAPAYINLSNLYYELGRIDDARQAYQKAYAIDPLYVRSVGRR